MAVPFLKRGQAQTDLQGIVLSNIDRKNHARHEQIFCTRRRRKKKSGGRGIKNSEILCIHWWNIQIQEGSHGVVKVTKCQQQLRSLQSGAKRAVWYKAAVDGSYRVLYTPLFPPPPFFCSPFFLCIHNTVYAHQPNNNITYTTVSILIHQRERECCSHVAARPMFGKSFFFLSSPWWLFSGPSKKKNIAIKATGTTVDNIAYQEKGSIGSRSIYIYMYIQTGEEEKRKMGSCLLRRLVHSGRVKAQVVFPCW